jgi:hypothetical protein
VSIYVFNDFSSLSATTYRSQRRVTTVSFPFRICFFLFENSHRLVLVCGVAGAGGAGAGGGGGGNGSEGTGCFCVIVVVVVVASFTQ